MIGNIKNINTAPVAWADIYFWVLSKRGGLNKIVRLRTVSTSFCYISSFSGVSVTYPLPMPLTSHVTVSTK